MSLWSGRRARRAATGPVPDDRDGRSGGAGPRVLVEDHGGLLLLRLPTDDTLLAADVTDLARALRAADRDTVTIVAVAGEDATAGLWPRLSESLDSLREAGTESVRLVMSGAGLDRPERPALARRIADAWELTVQAPDGPVLVVPGGSVFVPPGDGGWWRFAPGARPEPLGPRTPEPHWQAALREAPERTADGCVVHQIPAGLLIRPAEATAPAPGDLFHAVPVDPRRPAVIVGVPWGEDVLAREVADVLGALPAGVRSGVRLSPGGRRDLLPLGREVAALLDTEVEVTTGLPLFAADSPLGTYGVRSVLVGPDGVPRWLPFVDAVLCPPPPESRPEPGPDGAATAAPRPAPAPRLLRWVSPLPDPRGTENGVLHLSDTWRATITRAGLWVDRREGPPPPWSARPVSIEGPVVEVGLSGDRLDPSLWPVLSRLLGRLPADLRARTTLHVHATPPDGGLALRTLAADHALRVIRFSPPPAPAPAPARGMPSAPAARPVPKAEAVPAPKAAPAAPAGAGAGSPAAAEPVRRSLPGTPVSPRHRVSDPERAAFRALAAPVWERLDRPPAGARGAEGEAERADLVALRLYLQGGDGPLSHRELTASLRAGEERLLPYAACLASGLARLPAYRGAVLRGPGDADGLDALRPGQVLRDPAPVSGLPLGPGTGGRAGSSGFAIWSLTGRRAGPLLDDGDEVVFAPGTAFKVLGVRSGAAGPLVLLRQLPDLPTDSTVLEDADETALARLDHALTDRVPPGEGDWPDRCAGSVGAP
ncbi:hypothetical protein [Streptomyces daghestanicus]|uniref:Uncharacterized protein n=1 Tax=Streptomyces daghestanicus TaxID=66885 RepID=A0ABQ3QA09_9ACTN|nr:hypothetical protein [Streptomyces daghestanicus]GGU35793.1 hypothetical protein GCM10010259_27940 [Streptomyces daghestanicus]GHI34062.1 hypothetical protein Sdagh_57920 [Streptomyces daghestanicus]